MATRHAPERGDGDRSLADRPKVLYIGGTGRTGSTLLTRVLGEIPGWFAGGELAFLWRYGLAEGGRCSCGQPIASCDVWSAVLHGAASGNDTIDADRMVELRSRCWSLHLPVMALPGGAARCMDRLEEFPAVVERIYRSIAETTGSSVIVDSSKEPHYSWILRERTDLDVYFVHLVRNPRAVAHSWQRVRPERGFGSGDQMERRGPLRAATYFDVSNVAAELIWSRSDRYRILRYEEFAADPGACIEELARFVDMPLNQVPMAGSSFQATPQHMAWGNPNRFTAGAITIRPDDAWRTEAGRLSGAVMAAATGPVARRYGYGLRRSGVLGPPIGGLRRNVVPSRPSEELR